MWVRLWPLYPTSADLWPAIKANGRNKVIKQNEKPCSDCVLPYWLDWTYFSHGPHACLTHRALELCAIPADEGWCHLFHDNHCAPPICCSQASASSCRDQCLWRSIVHIRMKWCDPRAQRLDVQTEGRDLRHPFSGKICLLAWLEYFWKLSLTEIQIH